MILALAGRRVDKADAPEPRFPLANVEVVGGRIRALLQKHKVTAVVSSAACGADLLALSEAGRLGLRRCIVLPSEPATFRESSVIDRPGDWGALFDRILSEVEAAGDLLVIPASSGDDKYAATNHAILDHAARPAAAAVVWDRVSRGPRDMTEHFEREALKRALPVYRVPTIDHPQ